MLKTHKNNLKTFFTSNHHRSTTNDTCQYRENTVCQLFLIFFKKNVFRKNEFMVGDNH